MKYYICYNFFSADIAQLVEQCFRKAEAGGSSPPIGSSEISIMVVRLLPKQKARVRFSYLAPAHNSHLC